MEWQVHGGWPACAVEAMGAVHQNMTLRISLSPFLRLKFVDFKAELIYHLWLRDFSSATAFDLERSVFNLLHILYPPIRQNVSLCHTSAHKVLMDGTFMC